MAPTDTQLDQLSPRERAAIACAAWEHVLDLYRLARLGYRVGDADSVLGAGADDDLLEAALVLLWQHIERDKPLDPAVPKALSTRMQQQADDDADRPMPALEVMDLVGPLYHSASDPTPSATRELLDGCRDALVDMMELAEEYDDDEVQQAVDEEERWQERVAATVAGRGGGAQGVAGRGGTPLGRELLEPLIDGSLAWRAYLAEYAAP